MPKTADEAFANFTKEETILIKWCVSWRKIAREKQLAPDIRFPDDPKAQTWKTAGWMTGRSYGKTRLCANWLGQQAALTPRSLCAVVGPTHDDVRHTLMFGPTGLAAEIPPELITEVNKSLPSITLWNGSVLRGFAADTPERLRGVQHHFAWLDEVGSFLYPEEALYNLKLGLRLGAHPRMVWSTTPRPKQAIKQLVKDSDFVTTGSVYENAENLPAAYLEEIGRFEGTNIGRQELYGEILDPEELGIVKRSWWRLWNHDVKLPRFIFIVMSIDAATTEKDVDSKTHDPDFSACSVWGVFEYKGKRRFMLLDFWQDRLSLPDLIVRVRKERQYTYGQEDLPIIPATAFGRKTEFANFGRRPDLIIIEAQGGGRQLMQMLATEGVLCWEYNPGKVDKLQRLHMVSPAFVQGLVYVPESETRLGGPKLWAEEILMQICSYAGKGSLKHDDALDTATGALRYLIDNFAGAMTDPPPPPRQGIIEVARMSENPYTM